MTPKTTYQKPTIESVSADRLVESLGPAMAQVSGRVGGPAGLPAPMMNPARGSKLTRG